MPSWSLRIWQSDGARALDEIEAAHAAVGGTGRGRRYATQQINQAYAVILSAQFQRFCRDLHSEAVDHLVLPITNPDLREIIRREFTRSLKLDRGNPNPGNMGSDYERLDLYIWRRVYAVDQRNQNRRHRLETLNIWRNAIAHQDFAAQVGGGTTLRLSSVRDWRRACDGLARGFDLVVRAHLHRISGVPPW